MIVAHELSRFGWLVVNDRRGMNGDGAVNVFITCPVCGTLAYEARAFTTGDEEPVITYPDIAHVWRHRISADCKAGHAALDAAHLLFIALHDGDGLTAEGARVDVLRFLGAALVGVAPDEAVDALRGCDGL